MSGLGGNGGGGGLGESEIHSSRVSGHQRSRNEAPNQRYSNLIYDSEVFLTKLREFKPQSLGCLEARRKSSSTLIFPNPQQACLGPPKCTRYPHGIKPTPGYWIECHGSGPHNRSSAIDCSSHKLSTGATGTGTGTGAAQANADNESEIIAGQSSSAALTRLSSSGSQTLFVRPSTATSAASSSSSTNLNDDSTSTAKLINTPTNRKGRSDAAGHDQSSVASGAGDTINDRVQDHHSSPAAAADTQQDHELKSSKEDKRMMIKQDSLSLTRDHLAESSPNVMPNLDSTVDTKDSKRASEMRKRLNKRTMTRDDIDLHKPRRGTPNITITEPSFNQSTITYLSRHHPKPPCRQGSQGGGGGGGASTFEIRRHESIDSSTGPGVVDHSGASAATTPFSNRAASAFSTVDSPLSMMDDFTTSTATSTATGDNIQSTTAISSSLLRNEDSFDHQRDQTSSAADSNLAIQYSRSISKQQHQHRPSIIREDSGPDEAEMMRTTSGGAESAAAASLMAIIDDEKLTQMGLSTQTFQKKSYQEQQHQYQQQQQQLQQQQQQMQEQEQEEQQQTNTTWYNQFRDGSLELISFEEENYEKHYYGREHWNYFTNDELLGPVMLSLKQEVNNQRDHFHVLLRTVSYTLHGTIPASTICADRYDREAIVRELSEIAKLKPPLMLGQLPSTPDELLKLDHIFIKTELKVGVIYIKAGQAESEESILGNKEESPLFTEFLDLLGDRITLKGFDRYKGGLDTVHNLTGTESVYTMWRNIEIMFHVSTMLPHEENDPQKLQKKRHIGNDIVCVAFIEDDDTLFWPGCIKSYFLHTFITIRTSARPLKEGEKRKYTVSCVCRNEVQYAFKPYLVEQDEFYKSDFFREWLLVKIVNGERASYSAPKFARMQDRTRSQLLEDIITNLANHLVTGQIPKPYRRGSWRPLGHTRASSPLEDSMKDYFEDYDQLAKDFCNAFCGPSRSMLCDVVFKVKDKEGNYRQVHGVRAIMAIRSRTFLEMLYGFVPPGAGQSGFSQNQTNLRAIEMKALSGESSLGGGLSSSGSGGPGKELEHSKNLLAKRGSVGADSGKRAGERERRQSMLPNLSKSTTQKPNYLTVPSTGSSGTAAGGSGTGGMIKNAFNRLVSGNWSGWSGNIKGYKGEPMHIKVDQNKTKVDLNSLAICKEIAKIDTDKLTQKEFEIKEFDYETFQQTIEYIHNGQCKLSYETIPGLICAAEHYDLPDLLHACFHHANTHMKLSAAPKMMNALYQNSCFYVTAMQILDSIYEYIDPHGNEFFTKIDYYELYESVFTTLLSRKTLQVSEVKKFQAMCDWTKHQILAKQHQKEQKKLSIKKRTSFEQQQQQHQHDSQEQTMSGVVVEDNVAEETNPGHVYFGSTAATNEANTNTTTTTAGPTTTTATTTTTTTATCPPMIMETEEMEHEFRNLINRLNKEVNIKLDKISNEDLVRIVLPTKVFSNDKIFDVMADESRMEY